MGITESAIKTLTEPLNILIGNCGHSDCKSKCGDRCLEIEIDTTPVLQPKETVEKVMTVFFLMSH